MTIPETVQSQIRKYAESSWPDDKDMQHYIMKEELSAYKKLNKLSFSAVPQETKELILSEARDYFESWEEITPYVESEIEAFIELESFEPIDINSKLLKEWKDESQAEHESYFRGQLEYLQQKLSSHQAIRNTRKEIDPIKRLLIELEGIIGNECYNGNIQNYGSWGVLESEGRSFRYPVKFHNGETEYKRRNVTIDIPAEDLITGYYAFGANELSIYRGLHKVLKHLEAEYGLVLPNS